MQTFRPRQLEIQALQFNGRNIQEIRDLVHDHEVTFKANYRDLDLIMIRQDRMQIIHPQDWISWDGRRATVHSKESFAAFWELVSQP